jgi:hypothetical protein
LKLVLIAEQAAWGLALKSDLTPIYVDIVISWIALEVELVGRPSALHNYIHYQLPEAAEAHEEIVVDEDCKIGESLH